MRLSFEAPVCSLSMWPSLPHNMITSFYTVIELVRWQFRSPKANVLENKAEAARRFRSEPSQTDSLVTQLVKSPPAVWETWVQSLGWEDPLEKGMATHSSILARRIPWTMWVAKSRSPLSNFYFYHKGSHLWYLIDWNSHKATQIHGEKN